jgi:pyruvate dehydrogenase E2 component (dihydrolipoamide acetyltransferase)
VVEAPTAGTLRRQVVTPGTVVPVGALLGVIADPEVPGAEIDAFVEQFQASFVPGEEEEEEAGPRAQTVDVGTRRIRYVRRGDGPQVIVLVHGFGGDLDNWMFNADSLAEQHTVITLDLPGHGESSKDVGAGTVDEFVGVLRGFLDAVEVPRAHLVGHSLGGAVVLAFALADPARVASVTLIDSAGLGERANSEYIDGFVAANRRRELQQVLRLLFGNPDLVTRRLVDDVLKYKRLDGVNEALHAVANGCFPDGRQATVLADRLGELSVPLLVMWGGQDQIIPVADAEVTRGHGRVEVLPNVGHSPHMEAAHDVNRLLRQFVEGATQ